MVIKGERRSSKMATLLTNVYAIDGSRSKPEVWHRVFSPVNLCLFELIGARLRNRVAFLLGTKEQVAVMIIDKGPLKTTH